MKSRFLYIVAAVACAALAASCNPDDPTEDLPGTVINGVRWAPSNVDAPGTFAAGAADVGMYYQWGRRTGWSFSDPMTSSPAGKAWQIVGADGEAWPAASDPCPAGWRMPTQKDFKRLLDSDKVGHKWTGESTDDDDGGGEWDTRAEGDDEEEIFPAGMAFTDKSSGKSVFLPAAGFRYRDGGGQHGVCSDGFYWSSVADGELPGDVDPGVYVFCLFFYIDTDSVSPRYMAAPARTEGFTVRCVAK